MPLRLNASFASAMLAASFTVSFAFADQLTVTAAAEPAARVADSEWERLRRSVDERVNSTLNSDPRSAGGSISSEAAKIAELRRQAARLREFSRFRANERAVSEARQREATILFEAAMLGDDVDRSRREELFEVVRVDSTLSSGERYEVVAYSENLKVLRSKDHSHAARLDAFERVARQLIGEFPDVPLGYESLLGIARSKPGIEGRSAALELCKMSSAPEPIARAAKIFVERCNLVGRPIREVVGAAFQERTGWAEGSRICVYSWSRENEYSFVLAEKLLSRLPAETLIIGLCLDLDGSETDREENAKRLPGTLVYRLEPEGNLLCSELKLTEPALVYLTDELGVIRSISAHQDLAGPAEVSP